MHANAPRWLALRKEINAQALSRSVQQKASRLMKPHSISTMTVAEMLILVGGNPDRFVFEAALAKLCGVGPVPASSGETNRMRLNRAPTGTVPPAGSRRHGHLTNENQPSANPVRFACSIWGKVRKSLRCHNMTIATFTGGPRNKGTNKFWNRMPRVLASGKTIQQCHPEYF